MAVQKATTSGPVALFSGFPGGMWADAVAAVFPVGFRRCLFIPGKIQIEIRSWPIVVSSFVWLKDRDIQNRFGEFYEAKNCHCKVSDISHRPAMTVLPFARHRKAVSS